MRSVQSDLRDELRRIREPGIGTITTTGSALNRHFHTRRADRIDLILERLGQIEDRLDRSPRNWHCLPSGPCAVWCHGHAMACTSQRDPVAVCADFFEEGDLVGVVTLIHEAAHQAGIRGDTYEWSPGYDALSTTQALRNAESYALLARDARYGGPTAAVETWTSRYMRIMVLFEEPLLSHVLGHIDGEDRRLPPRDRGVGDRVRLYVQYHVDHNLSPVRRRPYTEPEVRERADLVRSGSQRGGLPRRERVLERSGRARDRGPGAPLMPPFGREIALAFEPHDRGTLWLTLEMEDFDTATTLTWRDVLVVRPVGAGPAVGP